MVQAGADRRNKIDRATAKITTFSKDMSRLLTNNQTTDVRKAKDLVKERQVKSGAVAGSDRSSGADVARAAASKSVYVL